MLALNTFSSGYPQTFGSTEVNKGSLLSTAIDAVPISGAVSGALGALGIDIKGELAVVSEFGWNSWGASTNPTQEMASVEGHVMPIIEGKIQSINDANVGEILTWIDGFLMFTWRGAKRLRDHHSRAEATREAHTKVMDKILELRKKFVTDYAYQLHQKGAKVSSVKVVEDFNKLESVYTYAENRKFGHYSDFKVEYKKYTIDTSTINLVDKVVETVVDESGKLVEVVKDNQQKAGMGIVGLLGIAGLAYSLLKK